MTQLRLLVSILIVYKLEKEPNLVKLIGNVTIVGDIHG